MTKSASRLRPRSNTNETSDENRFIVFHIVRSWLRDERFLKKSGSPATFGKILSLVLSDLKPFVGSDQIVIKPFYGTEDRYHATGRFHFPKGYGDRPEEVVRTFAAAIARAKTEGVHGSYRILNVQIDGVTYAASDYQPPGGTVTAGTALDMHDPAEMAGMIDWMDRHDKTTSYISDEFIEETLRQADPGTEAGKALRYGIVLGMQALQDSVAGKVGAPHPARVKARALMDLWVDLDSDSIPVP